MSKTYIACIAGLLAVVIGFHQPAAAQPRPLDKVVAVVDEGVILKSELERRVAEVEQQLEQRGGPRPPQEELRRQVLDQLITERLQLQMAERAGIRVDDNMLNQTMNNIAQQNNMSFDQFRRALESQGIYQQTRNELEKNIAINQLQNRAVNQRINITRQEIENYLRSETGQSDLAPEYHVAHILIPESNQSSPAQREELANLLHDDLQEGADIMAMAEAGTIAGISVNGGDLGWRKRENLPTVFSDVVPEMHPGEVSEPFTSSSGHHIVKLLETRGGVDLTVEQTHVRHILIAPNQIRTDEQAESLIHDLYRRITEEGEDFATIARQHTDDSNSMVSGGDLDWVSPGELPPDFMARLEEAEVGELIPPFRTESGWHIAEVLGRRQKDMTEENRRFRAERALRERKFELELENWLTEIRDTAFIEIKEENI